MKLLLLTILILLKKSTAVVYGCLIQYDTIHDLKLYIPYAPGSGAFL